MKTSILLLLLALTAFSNALWVEFPVTNDTNNQRSPALSASGSAVVYEDNRNGNWDIYLYNFTTQTERQITTSTADQIDPKISGKYVTCLDYRSGQALYLYNLATGQELKISDVSGSARGHHDLSSEFAVWKDNVGTTQYGISKYNLATSEASIIETDSYLRGWPAISGSYAVWIQRRSIYVDIRQAQLTTGATSWLTLDSPAQIYPAISGKYVAWAVYAGSNFDLFLNDTLSGQAYQITSDPSDQLEPTVDEASSRIAWTDYRSGTGNGDIYIKSIPSGVETRMTLSDANQTSPKLSQSYLVWQDDRNGNLDIYAGRDFLCGDADGNGNFNILDINFLTGVLAGTRQMPPWWRAADMDGSGEITRADIFRMMNQLSGIPSTCEPYPASPFTHGSALTPGPPFPNESSTYLPIELKISNDGPIALLEVEVAYDPNVLQFNSFQRTGRISQSYVDSRTLVNPDRIGFTIYNYNSPTQNIPIGKGSGAILNLSFKFLGLQSDPYELGIARTKAFDVNLFEMAAVDYVGIPQISGVAAVTYQTAARIDWSTDIPGNSTVLLGSGSGSYEFSNGTAAEVTAHSIYLTALSSAVPYYCKVVSCNSLACSTSDELSFTTVGEGTLPAISNVIPIPSFNSAVINWNTAGVASNSSVRHGTESGKLNITKGVDDKEENHSVTLQGLGPSQRYFYSVTSCNDVGCDSSTEREFNTTAIPAGCAYGNPACASGLICQNNVCVSGGSPGGPGSPGSPGSPYNPPANPQSADPSRRPSPSPNASVSPSPLPASQYVELREDIVKDINLLEEVDRLEIESYLRQAEKLQKEGRYEQAMQVLGNAKRKMAEASVKVEGKKADIAWVFAFTLLAFLMLYAVYYVKVTQKKTDEIEKAPLDGMQDSPDEKMDAGGAEAPQSSIDDFKKQLGIDAADKDNVADFIRDDAAGRIKLDLDKLKK